MDNYTDMTLATLLSHKTEGVRRLAHAILKLLIKEADAGDSIKPK